MRINARLKLNRTVTPQNIVQYVENEVQGDCTACTPDYAGVYIFRYGAASNQKLRTHFWPNSVSQQYEDSIQFVFRRQSDTRAYAITCDEPNIRWEYQFYDTVGVEQPLPPAIILRDWGRMLMIRLVYGAGNPVGDLVGRCLVSDVDLSNGPVTLRLRTQGGGT